MKTRDPIKEEQIIQAVFSIAARLGLEGIPIDKIAGETGLEPGSVYTYFNGKEDLIQTAYLIAMQKMIGKMYEHFDLALPIQESLKWIYFNALTDRLHHISVATFMDQYTESKYLQIHPLKQRTAFQECHRPLYLLLAKGLQTSVLKPFDEGMIIIALNDSMRSC